MSEFAPEVEAVLGALEKLEKKELERAPYGDDAEAILVDAQATRRQDIAGALAKEPSAQEELVDQILKQIAVIQKQGFALPQAPPNRRQRRAAEARARKFARKIR